MKRKYNFYAGPAVLPLDVLKKIESEIVDFEGLGLSIIETSHRSKEYDRVHNEAVSLVRELLSVPENYHILFLGGGATLQFSMIPLNFLGPGGCDFVISGSWAKSAYKDAKKVGTVNVLFDGAEDGYISLPENISCTPGSSYAHITSNETIGGVQWQAWPNTGDVPLIADMSSDIMSRPVPVDRFAMIYAGVQKNLGPAGAALVIIRDDMIQKCPESLTAYLSYAVHADKNSLYNTPPVFTIYSVKLVLEWVKAHGGLDAMQRLAEKRSSLVYDVIDESENFYRCPVNPDFRSRMNIVFRLAGEDLEKEFLEEATAAGMLGLKGHRSVGGCRASLYNAMPMEGAEVLADFMKDFASRKG